MDTRISRVPKWVIYNEPDMHVGCTCFGSTYTKIGTIQRRLAWPLRKDDTQIREAFHIFRPFMNKNRQMKCKCSLLDFKWLTIICCIQ